MDDEKADLESVEEHASQVEAGLRDLPRAYRRSASTDPAQVYSIRIPSAWVAELRRLADQRNLAPSAMAREWVLERLERELVAERLTAAAGNVTSIDELRRTGGSVDSSASLVWSLESGATT